MKIPCPQCGSSNTKCSPDGPKIIALIEKLLPINKNFPGGRSTVECKDCGYKGIIMVN